MNSEIVAAIITGICSLLGAIIGGVISSNIVIKKLNNINLNKEDKSINFNNNSGIQAGEYIQAGGNIINKK